MSLAKMLPDIQLLPRADKLKLIQFLAQDLAEAEAPAALVPGEEYPVWSPYDAFEAADTLLGVLRAEDGPAG
jgi:hypothetical protein